MFSDPELQPSLGKSSVLFCALGAGCVRAEPGAALPAGSVHYSLPGGAEDAPAVRTWR